MSIQTKSFSLYDKQRENDIFIYSCKVEVIIDSLYTKPKYKVYHNRINKITGSEVKREFDFDSFQKAFQNLTI